MSVTVFRTPRTSTVPGCGLQCPQPGPRKQVSVILTLSAGSVFGDGKMPRNAGVSQSPEHRKQAGRCQAAAVAAWTAAPLSWLKNQFSKEMWAHFTSSLSTLAAFVVCMALSVMIGATICMWRFHLREERRRIAQAKRREEGVRWIRQKVRRAIVLAQDINDLRMLHMSWTASEAARDKQLAQNHSRSLACTASPGARDTRHVTGRMLCASFREFAPDNWRQKATGAALYNTVHHMSPVAQESPEQELKRLKEVSPQVAREFYSLDAPVAGESDFERVKRVRKLAGTSEQEDQQLVKDVA